VTYLLILVGCAIFAASGGLALVSGLRDGRMSPMGFDLFRPPVARSTHPVIFWMTALVNSAALALAVVFAVVAFPRG
jgi:hypothetical protein